MHILHHCKPYTPDHYSSTHNPEPCLDPKLTILTRDFPTPFLNVDRDNKPHAEADNFRYFDPNLHDDSGNRPKEQRKAFKEAIVFVVGRSV